MLMMMVMIMMIQRHPPYRYTPCVSSLLRPNKQTPPLVTFKNSILLNSVSAQWSAAITKEWN